LADHYSPLDHLPSHQYINPKLLERVTTITQTRICFNTTLIHSAEYLKNYSGSVGQEILLSWNPDIHRPVRNSQPLPIMEAPIMP
jgi:hypothetical protein